MRNPKLLIYKRLSSDIHVPVALLPQYQQRPDFWEGLWEGGKGLFWRGVDRVKALVIEEDPMSSVIDEFNEEYRTRVQQGIGNFAQNIPNLVNGYNQRILNKQRGVRSSPQIASFCGQCGAKIPPFTTFCGQCGAKLK